MLNENLCTTFMHALCHVPGVPGILTFIDKNIEPLIF
jgi:hypothetical protein